MTFIGLQLLGSISLLSSNEPPISSNVHETKNVGGKNLKDLKKEQISSNLERGDYHLYFCTKLKMAFVLKCPSIAFIMLNMA